MSNTNTSTRLAEIISTFSQKRIVVVGDLIADQFIYGAISRVSREAPVFILRHEHTETSPGGAGNCAANLAALGAKVSLISGVGDDEVGRSLIEKLCAAGVDCDHVSVSSNHRTTTKVRVLAGQIHSTRQQVIRIDYDSDAEPDDRARDEMETALQSQTSGADGVIISDYNYGAAGPSLGEAIQELMRTRRIPVIVDSRFRLSSFKGFTSATPNEDEVAQLLQDEAAGVTDLDSAAEQLRRTLGYEALLVTRGGQGLMLVEADTPPLHIEAVGSRQPVDVTGAGDTVIATYTLALASGSSFADAARLANLAGGIVVMKRGTATVSNAELAASARDNC